MRRALAAWGVLLLLTPEPLHALTYTSEAAFLAAHPVHELVDFEGIAPPGGLAPAPAFADFTVVGSTPTSVLIADGLFFSPPFFPCPCPAGSPSDFLFDDFFNGSLTIEFDDPVAALGFHVAAGNQSGLILVEVLRETTLLEVFLFGASPPPPAPDITDFSAFIGFSDLGPIGSVRVSAPDLPINLDRWVNLDDLRFVRQVPEPALLLLIGLGGLATRRWARARRA